MKFAEAWLADKNSSVSKLISATEEAIEAMQAKYDEQELSYKEQGEALDKELHAGTIIQDFIGDVPCVFLQELFCPIFSCCWVRGCID